MVAVSETALVNLLATLDQSSDAIFLLSADWRYEYVNAAACSMLQRSAEQLLGQSCWELFPEMRHTENALILQRIMRERRTATWEARSALERNWVQCQACPLADGGLAVTVRRIDRHVRAERAHRDSERRFRALADLVPCVIWMADPSGHPTWVNQRWLEYSGMSLESLQSATLDALHIEDTERRETAFRNAKESKSVATFKHRLRRADGSYRWHLAQAQPILDECGEVAYWLGSAIDIQAERDVLASERAARRDAEEMRDHFHRVLAQVPLALAVFLGPELVVEVATPAARALYGCVARGQRAAESLQHAAIARGVLQKLQQTFASGTSLFVSGERIASEQEERVVDTHYSALLLASGEVYGVLVTSVDVTAQARARQYAEQERERLARVLDQAPFAVAITSGPDHVLRSANGKQLQLFGQRPTLNMPARVAFPEPELEPVHAVFDRAFHGNEAIVLRDQRIGWARTGSGEIDYGYFDLFYQPITDQSGRVEGLLCVSTDVSASVEARMAENRARDDAERALALAETARDRLDQILAAIPTAIAVTRGPGHVYELVNAAYSQMLGGREVLGRRVGELFPQIRDSGFLDLIDTVYHHGVSTELSERRVRYDKHMTGALYDGYFSSLLAPIKTRDGQITGVVACAFEVTDQVKQRKHNELLRTEAELAKDALQCAHVQLEHRIAERTAELECSNTALADEIATRNDLQRRLESAREDEQRRTARDLHDQVGQTLSALTLTIQAACESGTLPPAARTRLDEALRLAGMLGRDIHDIATRLRPAVLDAFGLHAALSQLLSDWSLRYGVSVDFEAGWLKHERFAAELETAIYRVIQEALTNVARHAKAERVSVIVEHVGDKLIVVLEDDGCGFDVSTQPSGRMGLESMRERVTLVGGTFDVEAIPGAGTAILVRIPCADLL